MAYPPTTSSEGEAVPNVKMENTSSLLRDGKDSFVGKTCVDGKKKKLFLNFLCACSLYADSQTSSPVEKEYEEAVEKLSTIDLKKSTKPTPPTVLPLHPNNALNSCEDDEDDDLSQKTTSSEDEETEDKKCKCFFSDYLILRENNC
jgi:hypothetical protein